VTIGALLLVLLLPAAVGARTGAGNPPFVGATLTHPAPPPDFALRDQRGHRVHLAALRGKVVLLTFLYTHCPDVCPLTATNLNLAVRNLGPAGRNVEILAVSVDPAGDTPAAVRAFVRNRGLGAEFHYLTGTKAKLAPIWRAYHVAAVSRGAGEVDHTLYTLLIDRSGKGRVIFDSRATAKQVAHDARLLLS
jgi:protein SCO1/2